MLAVILVKAEGKVTGISGVSLPFHQKSRFQRATLAAFICIIALNLNTAPVPGAKRDKTAAQGQELKLWHSLGTYNKDVFNSLLQSYNDENRQSPVIGVFQGNEEDLYYKLTTQESLPDIVQIPVQLLPPLAQKNLLADLTPLIPNRMREDISKKYWDSVSISGRIYGMPFSYNVSILFVNQHILRISGVPQDREPATWKELAAAALQIKQNTRDRWSLFIPMESATQFIPFVQSYTGKPVFQGDNIVVNSSGAVEAMAFLQDLVYSRNSMPPKITVEEGEGLFLSGNLGIMLASSSMLVYTESNLPYDLNVWRLPSQKSITPSAAGTCLAIIRSNARREREAFRFVEFLISADNSIRWHTHTGSPAIRTSVKESLDLLVFYEVNPNHMAPAIELEKSRIFNPTLDLLRSTGLPFDYLEFNRIVKKALQEIMINNQDPAKVLEQAQKEIDQIKPKKTP